MFLCISTLYKVYASAIHFAVVEVSREVGEEVVIQSERYTHQRVGGDVVVPQEFVHVVAFAAYLRGEPRHRASL